VAGTKLNPASLGIYCLTVTASRPARNAVASIDIGAGDTRDRVGVTLTPAAVQSQCGGSSNAVVGTANLGNIFADRGFYVVFN
jgi:hypothetical protein